MTNLSEEDIKAIAKQIIALTKNNIDIMPRGKTPLKDITDKYHEMLYSRYGTTGTIADSIRTTACVMAGQRYCNRLAGEQLNKACEYMEYIYKAIENTINENGNNNDG